MADNGTRSIGEKHLNEMTARQVDRKDGGWHGLGIHHRRYGSTLAMDTPAGLVHIEPICLCVPIKAAVWC